MGSKKYFSLSGVLKKVCMTNEDINALREVLEGVGQETIKKFILFFVCLYMNYVII
jgi:hypothetical protein